MSFEMRRAERDTVATLPERRLMVPESAERVGEVDADVGVFWIARYHALEDSYRLRVPPEPAERAAAIVERLHIVGPDRERPVKARQCFFVAVELLQYATAAVPGFRRRRHRGEHMIERGKRLRVAAEAGQCRGAIESRR